MAEFGICRGGRERRRVFKVRRTMPEWCKAQGRVTPEAWAI